MNLHAILSALVAAALAVAPFLHGTPQVIVGTVAGVVGTFVVRPSQVSGTLGTLAGKIPGNKADRDPGDDGTGGA
jgi:hypothetical protein